MTFGGEGLHQTRSGSHHLNLGRFTAPIRHDRGGSGGLAWLLAGFEDEVERSFGGASEPREACFIEDIA
jgi:hypothetical protein